MNASILDIYCGFNLFWFVVYSFHHNKTRFAIKYIVLRGAFLKAETPYRVDISLNGVVVAHTASQIPTNCASVVFDAQFLLM